MAAVNIALNVGQRPSADVGHNVDPARGVIVHDHDFVGDEPDIGDLAQLDLAAVWRVEQKFADAGEVIPDVHCSAHHHFKDLLFFEEVADHNALHQGRCGAPCVAGLDAQSFAPPARLTSTSTMGVMALALIVGFCTPSTFSRALRTSSAFSRRTGISVP